MFPFVSAKKLERFRDLLGDARDALFERNREIRELKLALTNIAKQETTSANATVKRMASIAKTALKQGAKE